MLTVQYINEAGQLATLELDPKEPIRYLSCCCCGDGMWGRQWWNRDTGFGLCDGCIDRCARTKPGEYASPYGVHGFHYGIPDLDEDALCQRLLFGK